MQPTLLTVNVSTEPAFDFTSERQLPIRGFIQDVGYREYDIMPSGEQFIMVFPSNFTESGERPQINIVLNWFEELRERVPVP